MGFDIELQEQPTRDKIPPRKEPWSGPIPRHFKLIEDDMNNWHDNMPQKFFWMGEKDAKEFVAMKLKSLTNEYLESLAFYAPQHLPKSYLDGTLNKKKQETLKNGHK